MIFPTLGNPGLDNCGSGNGVNGPTGIGEGDAGCEFRSTGPLFRIGF